MPAMQSKNAKFRRNDFDVSNTVNVTDPASVIDAIESIFLDRYPHASTAPLRDAVQHIARLYRGEHPDFVACDTSYHDLQHILDVTLSSARLMDGYERSHNNSKALGEELFIFGVVLALFHDSGYLRKRGQEDNRQGAEFTLIHVSRSAERVNSYMRENGMGELGSIAAQIVHFTGYEVPVDRIKVPSPIFRTIGNLVATGDIQYFPI